MERVKGIEPLYSESPNFVIFSRAVAACRSFLVD